MVDGQGRVRGHWRNLLGIIGSLGTATLAERARRLDRALEDEGVRGLLPGRSTKDGVWGCDPLPLLLPAGEFAALEEGLAQRARLLELILADLYGPQHLIARGLLPPALAFANPEFLRPCRRQGEPRRHPHLHLYAADLVRTPDGRWRVLADRTAAPAGIGLARENRRILARVMPESFRRSQVRSLRPFFDLWQDALQRAAPATSGDPAIAVLTRGTSHVRWFEDLLLSRELSCALVESADLTVRGGAVFLKTLQGLQRVDVLLSRLPGPSLDPLEFAASGTEGVPGLLEAWAAGAVRILNAPGSGAVEAPALAAFLPALAEHLLGEPLLLPGFETSWLGDPGARTRILADPSAWLLRPAMDGKPPAPAPLEAAALLPEIRARPADFAAMAPPIPSVVPCVGTDGLIPRPLALRLFTVFDGSGWRAMPGGLARIGEGAALGGALPLFGLSKDVWVLSDEGTDIIGPAALSLPPLPIRRARGALPSRLADNLFWLGRYTERFERAARLIRATAARIERGVALPREATELAALSRCLKQAGLVGPEDTGSLGNTGQLANAIQRALRAGGAVDDMAARIGNLIAMTRERLTADMYGAYTRALRDAQRDIAAAGERGDSLATAMATVIRFSTIVAGMAAENMVRGGGWLFLDLGRRVERAQAVAVEIGFALDQPPARIEGGLRLILELCDSVITYRSRYLTVLQPAPALDLVLADDSNPRGLTFQLLAMQRILEEVAGPADRDLATTVEEMIGQAADLVVAVGDAPDQAIAAAGLPPHLEALAARIANLSDLVTRRYFALLPAAQALGLEGAEPALRGAA